MIRRILFTAVIILSACTLSHSQEVSHHVIIPDGIEDTLNLGAIDYLGFLSNDSLYIHNPTDDTLIYKMGEEVDIQIGVIFFSDNGNDTIPPHTSKRASFVIWDFERDELSSIPVSVGTLGHDSIYQTEYIVCISEQTYAMDSTFDIESNSAWFGIRANQKIYFPLTLFDGSTGERIIFDSVRFYNRTDSEVTIQTAFILQGSDFSIRSFSTSFPTMLNRDEFLTVYLDNDVNLDSMEWNSIYVVTDPAYDQNTKAYGGRPIKPNPNLSVSAKTSIASNISLSPNPCSDIVTITRPTILSQYAHITIIDELGRIRMSSLIEGLQATLNVSELTNGTYICVFESPIGKESVKFIVNR